ncbi:MAG: VIT1/CCC1 transporter family protein [bacterium]|nr:VIT1/CCC1 transporter family protein [bacterium]
MILPYNAKYLHHQKTMTSATMRELVFGMEDGMVSTMGAITGIAMGTMNHFTIVLSGFVIVAVESISMAVGSYLSSKSHQSIEDRKIAEEKDELKKYPEEEKEELFGLFVKDGWSKEIARKMTEEADGNHQLMLREMTYRELNVAPGEPERPLNNAFVMGLSYIVGGAIPLLPYLLISNIYTGLLVSITVTLLGLFILGSYASRLTLRKWWKAGFEMLFLASAAALVGYIVSQGVERWWLKV